MIVVSGVSQSLSHPAPRIVIFGILRDGHRDRGLGLLETGEE